MPTASHQLARDFLAALSAGALPDALLTDDMQAWTVSSGVWTERARYQQGIKLLAAVFDGPYVYAADAITAEGSRVAIEARASGKLINGEDYANTYVFILDIKEGKIASVAEHFNTLPMKEKLGPLISQAMAKIQTD